MTFHKMIFSVLMLLLLLVGYHSVFMVKETERVLMLRFGKVISGEFEPGLHFKNPIHTIRPFDKRIQTLDAPPEHFLTSEKKNLIVDSFIKWRIVEIVPYFKTVGGSFQRAGQRLAEIIADGLRSEFGKRTIKQVVSGDRAEIMDLITKQASERSQQFGIEIIDVRIKQIELPKEVSESVYRRMETERKQDAKQLRSQGEAQAVRIKAYADRERVEVLAQAKRDAEKIRGEGEATAADVYAQAYNHNPEFYALYRSLNAYKETFRGGNDILLIQPDSEFFNYFKQLNGKSSAFSPVPLESPEPSTPLAPPHETEGMISQ